MPEITINFNRDGDSYEPSDESAYEPSDESDSEYQNASSELEPTDNSNPANPIIADAPMFERPPSIQAAIDNIVPTRLRPLRPRANRTNSTELGTQFLYIIHDENLLYDVPTSY